MINYANYAEKYGFSLTGEVGQEEVYNNVGSSAFSLKHDFFYSVGVWTGAGATGTQLILNTDYILVAGTSDLANTLNAKAGIVGAVQIQVTIINATYQTGTIYITPLVAADMVDNDDINLATPKRDTGANFTTLNPTLKNGEIAIESDTGLIKVGDGVAPWTSLSYNQSLPIGFVYYQHPNKDSPSDLGLTGTWTNISSTFAGNFFRTEGGNASAFESGTQTDQFQGHMVSIKGSLDGLGGDNIIARTTTGGSSAFTSSPSSNFISDGINGTPRAGTETRSTNETIRIWERTS